MQGTFGLAHLQEIHRRLYQDVWDWAGQLRTVEITKGDSQFLQSHFFLNAGEDLTRFLQTTELLTNPDITDGDFIAQAADLLEKVNYIHPFREGNGRTQRAYWISSQSYQGAHLPGAILANSTTNAPLFGLSKKVLANLSEPCSSKRSNLLWMASRYSMTSCTR